MITANGQFQGPQSALGALQSMATTYQPSGTRDLRAYAPRAPLKVGSPTAKALYSRGQGGGIGKK